jgi:hypothetical protein
VQLLKQQLFFICNYLNTNILKQIYLIFKNYLIFQSNEITTHAFKHTENTLRLTFYYPVYLSVFGIAYIKSPPQYLRRLRAKKRK